MNVGPLAETGVLLASEGLDELKRDMDAAATAAEKAGQRMQQSADRGARNYSDAYIRAQQRTIAAARDVERALATQFSRDTAAIREATARGFITPEQARAAGQEAAKAYNAGVVGVLDQLQKAGRTSQNSAVYRDLANNLKEVGEEAKKAAPSLSTLAASAAAVAAAVGLVKLERAAVEAITLSARYQTLGVAMTVVGHNAGQTSGDMSKLEDSLKTTGISSIQARQNLLRMAQGQIDFAHATDLARIAQDAAVIANKNSSETFEDLIYGIQSGNVRVLRTIGINVSFQDSYDKLAKSIGKTTESLTDQEKTTARVSAVLAAGQRIAGTYEAAMQTAGKEIKSTERYLEDLKVAAASAFLPAYTAAVHTYAGALKVLGENAHIVTGLVVALAAAVTGLLAIFAASKIAAIAAFLVELNPLVLAATGLVLGLAAAFGIMAGAQAKANAEREQTLGIIKKMDRASLESELKLAQGTRRTLLTDVESGAIDKEEGLALVKRQQTYIDQYRASLLELDRVEAARKANGAKGPSEEEQLEAGKKRLKLIEDEIKFNTAGAHAHDDLIERLDKERKEFNALTAEQQQSALQRKHDIELLGLEGAFRDRILIKQRAETETLKASQTLHGVALTARLEEIKTQEKHELVINRVNEQFSKQKDWLKLTADAMKDVSDIGERNIKTTQKQTNATVDAINAQAKFARTIRGDLLKSLREFSIEGVSNLRSFIDELQKASAKMLSLLQENVNATQDKIAQARKAGNTELVRTLEDQVKSLEKYAKIAAAIQIGVAGLSTAYSAGASSGSRLEAGAKGALAGATAGASIGTLFAPGIGTAIGAGVGATAGLVAGLLGFSDAAEKTASEARAAASALEANLVQMRATVHATDQFSATLASSAAQFDQLRDQAEKALGGKANEGKRERVLAEINALEAERVKQLEAENAILHKVFAQELGVRNLRAAGLDAQADALAQEIADANELRNAIKQFGDTSAEVQSLIATQAAEAAKRVKDRADAEKAALGDLEVRRLAAGGNARAADDLRFTLDQERELAAARKDGVSPEVLAATQEILALEKAAREEAQARVNQIAQEDARVRLLRATGRGEEADDLAFLLAQQREYNDAVKAGLDEATLAALALALAAESAQREAQKAVKAQRELEDLDVRGLKAQGKSAEADALRFALDQARELEDAISSGKSQEFIDRLRDVLALEKTQHDTAAAGALDAANITAKNLIEAKNLTVRDAQSLSETSGLRIIEELASIRAAVQSLDRKTGGYQGASSIGGGGTSNLIAQAGGGTVVNFWAPVYLDGVSVDDGGAALAGAITDARAGQKYRRARLKRTTDRT